jgi:hypothetical protein
MILFVPIGVLAKMQARRDIPLHHFEMPCGSCHKSSLAVSSFELDAATQAGPIKADINRLCTTSGCHAFDSLLTHPTGVVQARGIPPDMALDKQSRLTCLTCHNSPNRSNSFQPPTQRPQRMLYKPEGRQFCAKCHLRMSAGLKAKSHWQFSTRAHLIPENSQSRGHIDSGQFAGRIDSESRTCLSCHDDIFAVIPAYGSTTRRSTRFGRNGSDHPIGIDYAQAVSRRPGRLSFVPMTDERIRLFEGKVGCGSCHSLYAKTKNALVEPFDRDILCKKCHLL